jgi:hypothetical protein
MSPQRPFALRGVLSNASIQHRLKYFVSAAIIALVLYLTVLNREWARPQAIVPVSRPHGSHDQPPPSSAPKHTIEKLAWNAQVQFKQLLAKRSDTLEQAASRYRERRGRHPPPGFDAWYAAAQETQAIVVEDFFDRIYHDIGPFWAIDPKRLRRMIKGEQHYIRVRDGTAWFISDHLELRQP